MTTQASLKLFQEKAERAAWTGRKSSVIRMASHSCFLLLSLGQTISLPVCPLWSQLWPLTWSGPWNANGSESIYSWGDLPQMVHKGPTSSPCLSNWEMCSNEPAQPRAARVTATQVGRLSE